MLLHISNGPLDLCSVKYDVTLTFCAHKEGEVGPQAIGKYGMKMTWREGEDQARGEVYEEVFEQLPVKNGVSS